MTSTVTYLASQPKTQPLLVEIVPPLIGCMCTMAHSYLSFDVGPGANNSSNVTAWSSCYDSLVSKDLLMILQSLNYILAMLLIPESTATTSTTTAAAINSPTAAQSSRLRSFFKDIFQNSDLPPEVTPPPPPPPGSSDLVRDALLRELPAVMSLLIRVWGPPSVKAKSSAGAQSRRKSSMSSPPSERAVKLPLDVQQDETHNKYMLQDQILQIVEPIFITYPSHVLKSLLKYWKVTPSRDMEEGAMNSHSTSEAALSKKIIVELLTTLLATPASVDALFKAATQLLHQLHVITHQQHVTASNTNTGATPAPATKTSAPTSTSQVSGRVIDIEDKDIVLVDLLAALTGNRASQLTALELLDLFVPFLKQVVYTRSPYAFIHALHMLHLYVQACASSLNNPKTDKKKLKALGDVTQKMIEGCLYFACQSFGALVGDLNAEIVLGNVLSPQSLAISVEHATDTLTPNATSFVVIEPDGKYLSRDSVH